MDPPKETYTRQSGHTERNVAQKYRENRILEIPAPKFIRSKVIGVILNNPTESPPNFSIFSFRRSSILESGKRVDINSCP